MDSIYLTHESNSIMATLTVIQGIPNHWEFRVSRRNLLKKIKQSMHFVNLTCVILTSTLLKFVTDFSKLSAG